MTFTEMLRTVRVDRDMTQQDMAKALKISPQYYHDLEHGRRLPSVAITEAICKYLGRGPKGRLEWHTAGARAHGWAI